MIIISDPNEEKISEKTAKDMKDAAESVESAGKMGTFESILAIVATLAAVKDNPMLEVYMRFLELISSRINAEFAESAMLLAESLFGENAQRQVDRMAEKAALANKATAGLITTFDTLDKKMTAIDSKFSLWFGALDSLNYIIDKNINSFGVFSGALGSLNYLIENTTRIVKDFEEAIEDLKEELGID